jgi:DNA-nicking Smr family endonuclease
MARRARGLSEADRALWADYASQLAPLRGRMVQKAPAGKATPPEAVVAAAPPRAPAAATKSATPRKLTSALAVGDQPGGLDKAMWQRLRTGKLVATRRLDLHGMTAQRAFHALESFLHSAHADHVRCVEVVTGRGSGETGGVIRREFPHWLNLPTIRPLILGAAHPHALNPGSVRLILRRIR